MSVQFSSDYENQLFVKAEKCELHVLSVSFLGFIFNQGSYHTNPEKVCAIAKWLVPSDCKQLYRFLRFTNFYRQLTKDYTWVAAPLLDPKRQTELSVS